AVQRLGGGGGGPAPGGDSFDGSLATVNNLFPPVTKVAPSAAQLAVAVTPLLTWCRKHVPDKNQIAAYLRSSVPHDDKVAMIGVLADELTRMEFMLGGLYHGARSNVPWRDVTDKNKDDKDKDTNKDKDKVDVSSELFPDTYLAAAGGLTAGQDWCTA